jgi:hypothetical protein
MPVPVLDRIVQAPVFGRDGVCQVEPGYHPSSRTFHAPPDGLVIPDLPDNPSAEDVERAKHLILTELLGDFPFVGDADRAHAVALGLLPHARDFINGPTPAHNIEAPDAGSGKTLLARSLTYPSSGDAVRSLTPARDDDEWRKRITTALRDGAPVVLVDNINRALDSAALSSALTSNIWSDRLLGANEMVNVPVRCAWVFTANNPVFSTEIARRSIRVRIDPKVDRPFLREGFRHPDLNAWVTDHRGELIWANLVLIKSWVNAGRPSFSGRTLGSYEVWSRVIGGILEHVGISGFLANAMEFYEASDSEGAIWRAFVSAWWEKYQDAEVGTAELFAIAVETDGLDLGNGSEKSQRTTFGKALTRQRDRVIDGYRVVQTRLVKRIGRWRLLSTTKQEDSE